MRMAITKTDFMRGMQCPKMLWLDRHRPGLRVIPPEVQVRLDAGNEYGDRAMAMFGPFEEMTAYRPGTRIPDKKAMLENTKDALRRDVPVICEAAFSDYNNYCAVDILRKTETGHDIYEVKNAGELREQFIRDAAFQYYIAARSGLRIGRVFIVLHRGGKSPVSLDQRPYLGPEPDVEGKGGAGDGTRRAVRGPLPLLVLGLLPRRPGRAGAARHGTAWGRGGPAVTGV